MYFLSWNSKQTSFEDKFVVISLTEKAKSHLLPDLTAKDRAREYRFYVDDRLKMQRYDR